MRKHTYKHTRPAAAPTKNARRPIIELDFHFPNPDITTTNKSKRYTNSRVILYANTHTNTLAPLQRRRKPPGDSFSNRTFLPATATQIPNIINFHPKPLYLYAANLHKETQHHVSTQNITLPFWRR